jgi:hypothetical protein
MAAARERPHRVDSQVTLPALLYTDGVNAHLQRGGGPTVEVGGGGTNTHLECQRGGTAGSSGGTAGGEQLSLREVVAKIS